MDHESSLHVEFSIPQLAREVGETHAAGALGKGLAFELRLDSRVPERVVGDPGRLRRLLDKLLGNALRFTDSGLIGVDIHPAPPVGARLMVGFTVHDSGCGIALALQPGLLQQRKGPGQPTVGELCEQMGGSLSLNSEPGRGASFRCVLSFTPAAPTAVPVAAQSVQVFDEDLALRRLHGDAALLRQVLASFVEGAPRRLAGLRRALDLHHPSDVHRGLHWMAASAAMVGAPVLCELARDLGQMALHGELRAVADGIGTLQAALDDFLAHVACSPAAIRTGTLLSVE